MKATKMDDKLANKLKELKKAYLQKLEGILLDLKNNLDGLPDIELEELYTQVHKISGTSGMYGLKELSGFSSEFEIYLKEIKNNNAIEIESLKGKLSQYIKIVEQVVSEGK